MNVKRNGRTSKLRLHRLNSPRRFREPSCRDTAPGSRCSFAGAALNPLRRTKRTSKPCRLRRLRNDRTCLSLSWRRRASVLQRASLPGRPRRRRPPPEQARRSGCRAPLRCARACVFCFSPAPCAGGSRESGLRTGFPPLVLSCIWRARRPGFFPGRSRTGCDPVREGVCRIFGKGLALCARPPYACGVCAHKRVSFPDPCEASCLPPWGGWNPAAGRRDVFRTHLRHSIFPQTRCSPHS